jgi:hypothetical protein
MPPFKRRAGDQHRFLVTISAIDFPVRRVSNTAQCRPQPLNLVGGF